MGIFHKIITFGLLILLSHVGLANKLMFKGSGKDSFFWFIADIKTKDGLVKTVDIHDGLIIDSLKSDMYQVTFFSIFADRQTYTIDLVNKNKAFIKIPSCNFYSKNKSDSSLFEKMNSKDTLRIYFENDDGLATTLIYYALILKKGDAFFISYNKWDSNTKSFLTLTKTLTSDQLNKLKEIEAGTLDSKNTGMVCSMLPTYYFELNRKYERHRIGECQPLESIVEKN